MSLSVLVIEDDESVAGVFREIYSRQGWDVSTPQGGASVAGAITITI
ncbi:MAG: hypothetical protein WBV94_30460 [Blastocatellia bacterium]